MWQGLLSATTALGDDETSLLAVRWALDLQPRDPALLELKADFERVLGKR